MKSEMRPQRAGMDMNRRTLLKAASAMAFMAPFAALPAYAQGGDLIVGTLGDTLSFDGYHFISQNYPHQRLLYDYLVAYDYDLNPTPWALESWKLADDQMSATLKMRPDIMLHSGRLWNEQDLVKGFARSVDPKEGLMLLGMTRTLDSFSSPAPLTVELKFKTPVSDSVLTDMLLMMPVVDGDHNSVKDNQTTPAGSGPFKLQDRTPGDNFVLVKNQDYWQKGLPLFDSVTFQIFDNADSMVSALESGSINLINVLPPNHAERLVKSFNIIEGYPAALADAMRMNPLSPPFDNPKLRQAIFRAVDRERIAKEVYAGYARPAFLPWSSKSAAYDASYNDKLSFDLDAAKALIEQAGPMPAAKIMTNTGNPIFVKAVEIIQADLRRIGFNLEIDAVESAVFSKRAVAGDFGVFYGEVGTTGKRSPASITTNSFMRLINNPVWKDKVPPAYVDAIAKVGSAKNREEEVAASAALNKVFVDKAWFVPTVHKLALTAADKDLTGLSRDIDDRLLLLNAQRG